MKFEEFADKFKKGDVKPTASGGGYEETEVVIKSFKMVKVGDTTLASYFDDKETPMWQVELQAHGHVSIQLAPIMTKNGDIACYPSNEELGITGTLLYDLIHGVKEFSEAQAKKIEGWNETPSILLDNLPKMRLKMGVRVFGQDKGITVETSRQKSKDAEYRAKQDAEKNANQTSQDATAPVSSAVDVDDLPFS